MMTSTKRKIVWDKYNGHCSYCGKKIDYKDMQVDHIIPRRAGGTDDMSNLNPSCRRCNHYKRAYKLERYRDLISKLHIKIQDTYLCKTAEDYGIIKFEEWDGLFYFERKARK